MTREKHTQRGTKIISKKTLFYPRHLLRVCFLCVCRSDIWVPRSLSMYTPMDDDTSIASRTAVHRTARAVPLSVTSSSSHARARERTRGANERTKERTRIFFSRRYRHDAHRYASRARLDRECARAHSRGNAIRIFGNARERDAGDAGDAETREGARGMFWIFFWVRVRSRRRRAVVARSSTFARARSSTFARARTTTGRRPGEDGASTGRNGAGVNLETICSYDLSMGCGRSRERERERLTDGFRISTRAQRLEAKFSRCTRTSMRTFY